MQNETLMKKSSDILALFFGTTSTFLCLALKYSIFSKIFEKFKVLFVSYKSPDIPNHPYHMSVGNLPAQSANNTKLPESRFSFKKSTKDSSNYFFQVS